jgi:hypothetical protein
MTQANQGLQPSALGGLADAPRLKPDRHAEYPATRPSGGDQCPNVQVLSVSTGMPEVVLNLLVQPALGGGVERERRQVSRIVGQTGATQTLSAPRRFLPGMKHES